MKNKWQLITSIFMSSLLAISCSTSQKYSKQSFGGSWENSSAIEIKEQKSVAEKTDINPVAQDIKQSDVSKNTPAAETITHESKTFSTTPSQPVHSGKISSKAGLFKQMKAVKQVLKSKHNPNESNAEGILFILLFILCFLIPPLAYFLATGDTGTWFIIDLLLFIFGLTWFVGVRYGLAGLLSIVIALLGLFGMLG